MALGNNGNGNGLNPDSGLKNDRLGESARRQYAAQLGLDEDDPILAVVQSNAVLEGKVDLWSTAILELVQITRAQSQAMQETAENSLKLTQALQRSETESQQLRLLIKQLGDTLSKLKVENAGKTSTRLNQSTIQSLMPQFQKVNIELLEIRTKLDLHRKTYRSHAAGNVNRLNWMQALLVMNLVLVICVFGFSALKLRELSSGQGYLASQSSWLLTKLERVEKVLGIRPRK